MDILRGFYFEIGNKAKHRRHKGRIVARSEEEAIKRLKALNKKIESLKITETKRELPNIELGKGSYVYPNTTPMPTMAIPKR